MIICIYYLCISIDDNDTIATNDKLSDAEKSNVSDTSPLPSTCNNNVILSKIYVY